MKSTLAISFCCALLLIFSTSIIFAQQSATKAIVDEQCSKCHSLKRVYNANKNAAAWEKTIDAMIKKGATINPEEKDPVLKYLNTLNK
jgi:hypothetical protein